jgi:hypothetical protein
MSNRNKRLKLLYRKSQQEEIDGLAKLKKYRKGAEQKVLQKLLSSLSQSSIVTIRHWTEIMHLEVHGSRATSAWTDLEYLSGRGMISLVPLKDNLYASCYCNSAYMVFWLLHRTLPVLQLKPGSFGKEWAEKWHVLDASFRAFVQSFVKDNPKLPAALEELTAKVFAFSPEKCSINQLLK